MKRKFTLLIAALALLTMIVQPGRAWGQTKDDVEVSWTASEQGYTNAQDVGDITIDDHISGTFAKNSGTNGPKYYTSGESVRMYNLNSLTITPDENSTITAIIFTLSQSGGFSVSTGEYSVTGSTGTWSGSSTGSIVFTNGSAQNRIQVISVTYTYSGTPAVTHTLTYSANPTEGGTVTVGSTTLAEGATTSISATANAGYVFSSWTVTGEGSSVNEAGDTFTMGTEDATLTANFTAVTTYKVTYYANNGTETKTEVEYNDGEDVTVAANTFSYTNHDFTKWHTNAAGTGGTNYNPGDVIENISADINLYAQWEESSGVVDVLNWAATGSPTSYTDWTYTAPSGTAYKGQSSGNATDQYIQLRSNNNNSGIVTTSSIGNATKVVVTWNNTTASGRTLNIYGKNTAYTAATDLYGANAGTLIGTIVYGTSTELNITNDYEFIGMRSNNGALYLDEVRITWATGGSEAPSITANNVEIDYDATAGSIAYEINNVPTPAGTLTATTTDTWLTLGTVGETVPFSCSANSAATERTATVTLTYTYGDSQTVTKNVTVTQDGNPDITPTIAEVRAQGTGTVVTKGFVTSITGSNNKTAYIQDATAAIVVYGNFTAAVGDEIRVSGTLSNFNGLLEITSPTVTVLSSGNTINPQVMTIAEIVASENQGWYVRIEDATVTIIDGQNTTIAQGDNTIVVRGITGVEYAVDDVISLNGNIGCYNDVNQIANPQNVEVQQSTEPSITVANATVNVTAEGGEGTLTVSYDNITEIAAEVWFCNAEGTEDATYDWITASINANNNVEYLVEPNDGEARTAYFEVWAYDDEFNEVYSNLVTVSQDEYVAPTYAELPFNFNGGKADIENTAGLYQEGLGDDYNNSPKLRFDNTGDWLLLQFNERPGTLTFDIKGNSFSGGTFTVQTSEDGVSYTDLKTYTELGSTQSESFDNLSENVRYIKWIYTNKVSGNVGLGNIALAQYTVPVPSISANDVSITYDAEEGEIVYTINNPVEGGILTANTEADWLMLDNVDETVPFLCDANTATTARTATVTLTYTYENSKASVTKDVTVTQDAAPAPTYTVMFELDGGTFVPNSYFDDEIVEIEAGTYNLPSATKTGFTFAGWNNGINTYAANAEYTVSDNVEFTAQWTETPAGATYTLITDIDQIVSGKHYIIVGLDEGDAYGIGGQATNNRTGTSVTITSNQITAVGDAKELVINGPTDGKYTIYDAAEPGYLYAASNTKNYLKTQTALDDNGKWTISLTNMGVATITAQGANGRNLMRFNPNNGSPLFACYATNSTTGSLPYIYVKDNDTDLEFYNSEVTLGNITLNDEASLTIGSGSVVTVTGTLTNNNSDALIIEDGGQLIVNNSVAATVEKTIQASESWGSKDGGVDGWDLISSPIGTVNIASVTNLAPAQVGTALQYDLYSYNEASKTWYNQQGTEHQFTQLMVGEGYLYSRKENADLGFAGVVSSASITKALTYTETNGTLAGWNLVGNPYTHNITWANLEPTNVVTTGYYTLGYDGQWSAEPSTTTVIKPMQGFLVKANALDANIVFNNTASSKSRANDDYIKFIVANSQYEDAAYAMFSENEGLDKINHRNADIPMVYIPQNGQNYAIATMDDNTQAFELNFKAMTTGQYTLSYKAEGKYSYLHVIDRLTGEDIDMLLDGEYSFIGSPRDNEARFIVKLSYNANIDEIEVNDNFAYQNGSDIIVNGNGELQVFDVTGRMVMNTKINGIQTVNVPATGMYIFRMVGESVQTQKIVVR